MIEIRTIDDQTFEVTVDDRTRTTHVVTVKPKDYQHLTGGAIPIERLVEKSFEFLLQHEPNTSILRSFDLMVIGRYFPEYEKTISSMLGR